MTRTRRPTAVVALGALAVLLLAGCGLDRAGAAAVVGDQRITETQVSDAVAQVRTELGTTTSDTAAVTTATVTRLTQAVLVADAAEREGIEVTESQVDALLAANAPGADGMAELEKALLTQLSIPRSAVRSYARTFLQQQRLGAVLDPSADDGGAAAAADYLRALSTELGTEISPRYGTWDPATLALGAPPTDLAAPAR